MSNPFVTSLRKEIRSLEKELEGDPRFKKLRRLMSALEVYLEDEDDGDDDDVVLHVAPSQPLLQPNSTPSAATSADPTASPQKGRTQSDKNEQILEFATSIIRDHGNKPIRTRNILAAVQASGIEVHGKNPRNTLSALLSYSERFIAHGKSGWTIKSEDEAAKESEVADASNLPGRTPATSADHRLTNGGTLGGPVNPRPGGGT